MVISPSVSKCLLPSGYFHISENGCALVLQKDLEYWLLDELIMEPCCALKYFPKIEVTSLYRDRQIIIGL